MDAHAKFHAVWFRAYRLALRNSGLAAVVEASKPVYKAWGNIEKRSFNHWWRGKKKLFTVHIVRADDAPSTSSIIVSIPRHQPLELTTMQMQELLKGLSENVMNYDMAMEALEIYSRVYIPMSCRDGANAGRLGLANTRRHYRKINRKLPSALADNGDSNYESARQALHRYIVLAEKLVASAAAGTFPRVPKNFRYIRAKMEAEFLRIRQKRAPFLAGTGLLNSRRRLGTLQP